MTTVRTTMGDEVQVFSIGPREAVICAYAQSLGDYNTWGYESRYGHKVAMGTYGWCCGEFWAKLTGDEEKARKASGKDYISI